MIGKEHKNMMRDIRKYIEDITHNLENSKLSTQNCESGVENSLIELSDYFIESTYQGQRRKEKCYLITKKGCEFIYNKLQGKRVMVTLKQVKQKQLKNYKHSYLKKVVRIKC